MNREKVLISILIIYSSLLVISAWPIKVTGPLPEWITYSTNFVLYNLTILPGHKLFYRPYPEVEKIRHQCMIANLYKEQTRIHQKKIGLGCQEQFSFRWFSDPYEAMMYRLFDEIVQLKSHARPGQEPGPRELALVRALGDYFCHHKEFETYQAGRVHYALKQSLVNYRSGQTSNRAPFIVQFNCRSHEIEKYAHGSAETKDMKLEFEL